MSSNVQSIRSSSIFSNYSYLLFLFFTLTRPISIIDMGIPFFRDFYAIVFGYIFLLYILITASKVTIDRTGFLILLFIIFCGMSFAWGTHQFRDFSKLTLPFVFFFYTRTCILEKDKIDSFFKFYIIGFFIPLILSTICIVLGLNIQAVEFLSKVPRHSGVYNGAHTLAYQMSFFSFVFCYNLFLSDNKNRNIKIFCWIMFIFTVFCLFKSYTRTAYIGFVLFWGIFFFGNNRKYFYILAMILVIIGTLFSYQLSNIFLKQKGEADLNVASSGRIEIWEAYSSSFIDSSFPEKVLGKGIGWKVPGTPGAHNEFLQLLIENGLVGLFLYASILISILIDIFSCRNVKIKYFFGGILIPLIIMSFGSNVIISFFELSILLWIFMGFFYNLNEMNNEMTNK